MKDTFHIVPYQPEHEEALLELERRSFQGYRIKMQLVREFYHSRAMVFEDYQAYVALGQDKVPIACATGAQVPLAIAGKVTQAGYGFNVRVSPSYRKLGLGMELTKHLSQHYFEPRNLHPQFTTIRTSNLPVLKLLNKTHHQPFRHEFVYLTFSTAKGIQVDRITGPEPNFHVDLLSCQDRLTDYYQITDSGLGLWKTYQLYQLKIGYIHPLVRALFWVGNKFNRNTKLLPATDSLLKMVTVFNLNQSNIDTLPAMALQLYKEGIHYMQVCCQPNDLVFKSLQSKAINVFNYYLVSTSEIRPQEPLILDIRCL